jgi:oligopeptide/dipeptide ABC transporter ATP-binding protein
MNGTLLHVADLRVSLEDGLGGVPLLDGVDLAVGRREVVGIVGESGSGKSMLALAVAGLLPGNIRVTGGSVRLDGRELIGLSEPALRPIRGARIAMVFQEPMTALNPVMTAGGQVAEMILAHQPCDRATLRRRVEAALEEVGLSPAAQIARMYPHELSGGMRQRVMIAIAIACSPDLIIADEPTTALDVTVQAQILALLRDIVARRGCSLLLISHDIGVIAAMCDRVVVMYGGRVVEDGPSATLLAAPRHPYARLLLDTYVDIDMAPVPRLPTITGGMPLATQQIPGCRFGPRCPSRIALCGEARPVLEAAGSDGHAACHRWRELS